MLPYRPRTNRDIAYPFQIGIEHAMTAESEGIPKRGEQAVITWLGGDVDLVEIVEVYADKNEETGEISTGAMVKLENGQIIQWTPAFGKISAVPLGDGTPASPIVVAVTPAAIAQTPLSMEKNPTLKNPVAAVLRPIASPSGISLGRFVFYSLVVGLVCLGVIRWWQSVDDENIRQAARNQERQAVGAMVMSMASKANANTEWKDQLVKRYEGKPARLLTADVQKAWVQERPILFVGTLDDVIASTNGTFDLVATLAFVDSMQFDQSLRISASCPPTVAIPVIESARKKSRPTFRPDIAIVALIDRVDTQIERIAEGDSVTAIVGIGRCISATYLPDGFPR